MIGVGSSKEQGWLRYGHGVQVNLPYHIRVLVPCYKESFDIVTRTIMVGPITHSQADRDWPSHCLQCVVRTRLEACYVTVQKGSSTAVS